MKELGIFYIENMVEFFVVNCCFCDTYQGQQVIKAKKWTCKMCGEKQSFRKILGQGTGKECRKIVQQLNMVNGNLKRRMLQEDYKEIEQTAVERDVESHRITQSIETKQSKWDKFLPIDSLNATETEDPSVNFIESTSSTEQRTFNQPRALKRKASTKDMPSDNLNENQERKKSTFNDSNRTYLKSKSNMTSQTTTDCQLLSESRTKNYGQIKVSKWSKFV
ncbi:MRN complex-interacting protein-like [Dendronephthya gigantea]|uniref:MRN complex-interacting protein-like n=1 Tax=Dendronephthya gigantea TaxID=151771 RepID=UPI00106A31E1|nr:MRN complex-interacting protein-like [Dendronephthya gigantea]